MHNILSIKKTLQKKDLETSTEHAQHPSNHNKMCTAFEHSQLNMPNLLYNPVAIILSVLDEFMTDES